MPITPDTKDWTWVLARPCPECGFDTTAIAATDVARLAREQSDVWVALLASDRDLRARPSDDRWSALEYACHVRDVFRLADRRVELMTTQDDPTFANWDQDATAIEDAYERQEPADVATQIGAAASALASRLDAVSGDVWLRSGRRSDGARFTVESFARYVIHDPIHHVVDVGASLPGISPGS